jgi:short-subunit dehydrogenase
VKVADKVLVVTGAGSGMGRAVVLEAVRRRARVAAVDRNPASLEETAALASGGRVTTHTLDVTDRTAVDWLPAAVAEAHGSVDGLIHCAGIIQPFVRVKDLDDAAIDRVMGVNWWGTLHLNRAFLPVLLGRPEGHIVNVSSMGGAIPVPGQTVYGASKAAVKLFTEALWAECRGTGVRVTLVIPGGVATNITSNSGVELPIDLATSDLAKRKATTAEEAANAILDGMEKNAYRVLIGRDAKLMDLLYRINPKGATAMITRQMKDLLRG